MGHANLYVVEASFAQNTLQRSEGYSPYDTYWLVERRDSIVDVGSGQTELHESYNEVFTGTWLFTHERYKKNASDSKYSYRRGVYNGGVEK